MKKTETTQSKKRKLTGIVTSDKMTDTCVVLVQRYVKVPKYQKFIQRSKKYKADDKGNTKKIGDKATIEECPPISKDKHFKIIA
jgi:small subunit ribosomal protein S17